MQLAKDQDVRSSPTLLFNEGRQRLSGNVGYRIIEANVRELLDRPIVQHSWC
jgi:predicted DsbA family dithiol-disulfide isomerase